MVRLILQSPRGGSRPVRRASSRLGRGSFGRSSAPARGHGLRISLREGGCATMASSRRRFRGTP
eukprot:955853-Lingulodinium_polyedra.AAC.1